MCLEIQSINLILFLTLNNCLSDEIYFFHVYYGFKNQNNWSFPYEKNTLGTLITFFVNAFWNMNPNLGVALNVYPLWTFTDFCKIRLATDQIHLQSPITKAVAQERWPKEVNN